MNIISGFPVGKVYFLLQTKFIFLFRKQLFLLQVFDLV